MQKHDHASALPRRKELAKAARLAAMKRAAESINRSTNEPSAADRPGNECINRTDSGNNDSGNAYSRSDYFSNDYSSRDSSRLTAKVQPSGPTDDRLKQKSADITEGRAAAKRAGAS